MNYESAVIPTPDGRDLEIAAVGDRDGRTVFFHHGTPGSAPMVRTFEAMANDRGYFIVTTSRAGYGLSSRRAGRNAADVVTDVRAALDVYGRGDYLALGWSGGGPHALACAALDRPRCTGVITLAGVAPSTDDFDWTEGMGPENVEEFAVAREGGQAHEDLIELQRDFLAVATPDSLVEMLGGLLSEADKVALKDREALETMTLAFQHGLEPGYFGFLDDDRIIVGEWGFALSDVAGPVEVWFGDQDLMVPPSHGRFLATHLTGAASVFYPGEGHISIVTNFQTNLFDHLDNLYAS